MNTRQLCFLIQLCLLTLACLMARPDASLAEQSRKSASSFEKIEGIYEVRASSGYTYNLSVFNARSDFGPVVTIARQGSEHIFYRYYRSGELWMRLEDRSDDFVKIIASEMSQTQTTQISLTLNVQTRSVVGEFFPSQTGRRSLIEGEQVFSIYDTLNRRRIAETSSDSVLRSGYYSGRFPNQQGRIRPIRVMLRSLGDLFLGSLRFESSKIYVPYNRSKYNREKGILLLMGHPEWSPWQSRWLIVQQEAEGQLIGYHLTLNYGFVTRFELEWQDEIPPPIDTKEP